MRALFFEMASNDSFSIVNPNCDEKRMARIMRNGSSLYVTSGSKGVRSILFSISPTPLNGSNITSRN